MAASVVGLDIASSSLRAVEIDDARKPRPTILRAHEVPLPDGSVKRGEVLEVNTVASALKRLWAAGGFKSRDVALGIGGQSVIVRDLTVPRMPLTQVREALPFQVQDLLPVPASEAVLDFYPLAEGENETGAVIHGLLVAAFKSAVSTNVDAVMKAGLNPVSMDLLPFAMTRMHHASSPTDGYAVHMGIGANTTSLVIVRNGVPQFVRVVPMGGDDCTRALMSRLSIPRERAEGVKRHLGLTGQPTDDLQHRALEVIHESTSELLTTVRNTLAYFASIRPGVAFEHLSTAGGATRMNGFPTALADSTRIPVIPVDPLASAEVGRALQSKMSADAPLDWVTALGLAIGSVS